MAELYKHTIYVEGKDVSTMYGVADGTKAICSGSSLYKLNLHLRTIGFDTLENRQGMQLQGMWKAKEFLDVIIIEGLTREELSQLAVLLTSK